jgi:hypothetical protein
MRERRRRLGAGRLGAAGLLLWLGLGPLAAPLRAQSVPRLKALIVDGQSNHGWRETTAALKAPS